MVKVQIDSQGKVYTSNGKALLVQEGSGTPVIESLSITPTTSSQTITAQIGVDGYSPITISAVTSSIDSNIQAGNIKKDIQILGVTGALESGITPSGTLNITQNGTYDVTNYASAEISVSSGGSGTRAFTSNSWIDTNGNIHNIGEDMAGNSIGAYGGILNANASIISIKEAYSYAYNEIDTQYVAKVDLSSITTISGSYALESAFENCENLITIDISNLTTISGDHGLSFLCADCKNLTVVSLSSLISLSVPLALKNTFSGCISLTDIYFNSLTTSSFGSNINQFDNMMKNTGISKTHTLHFPSNLQSIISGLTGYPLFGGTSGYVVLAFDLPATS